MKTLVASLALAGTLIAGSMTSAQSVVSLPAEDTLIKATFYDANPAAGGEIILDDFWNNAIEVTLDDSAVTKRISGVEDAEYVVLEVGDVSLTFDTAGGSFENTIELVYDGNSLDGNLTLANVVDDITAALEGAAELAVFTDADGVVTGFYKYTDANMPNVNVAEAEQVLISHDGQLETFETVSTSARALELISVTNSSGETVALGSLLG